MVQWLAQRQPHRNTYVPGSLLGMLLQLAGPTDGEAGWTLFSYCPKVPTVIGKSPVRAHLETPILPGPSGLGLWGGHGASVPGWPSASAQS